MTSVGLAIGLFAIGCGQAPEPKPIVPIDSKAMMETMQTLKPPGYSPAVKMEQKKPEEKIEEKPSETPAEGEKPVTETPAIDPK